MNDTQNKKIAQVTDKTLVVGVGIGSDGLLSGKFPRLNSTTDRFLD